MSKFWSEKIKTIEAYVPGEQPKDKRYIKLNTNENPYPPSPKVLEAIKAAADEDLRLYPDPTCNDLREEIASYFNLKKEQIFIGNGSDELLAFCFLAFFNPGKPIMFTDITYSFYEVYASLFNIDYELIKLDEEFNIPVEEFFAKNGGILISNPNAPTGKYISNECIESILKNNSESVVIIDEAYIDFGGESAVELINRYPNLMVTQTLSKSRSLAGLRGGFALGSSELIEGLDKVKNSFNSYTLDKIALAGSLEAFRDKAYFEETRTKVIMTREKVAQRLLNMGFKVVESKANFLFISCPKYNAESLFMELKERGILVRYFKKPRIKDYLRVTIGTDDEMNCFINAVEEITGI